MQILFFTRTLDYGGAAKILSFLANKMSKDHQVTVLFYEPTDVQKVLNKEVNTVFVPLSGVGLKARLNRFSSLKKYIKKEKPDVIVSFLSSPNFYATLIGKLIGVPVIISERGDPSVCTGLMAKLNRRLYNLASGAVFQTEAAKSYYYEKLKKKSIVIPNPVSKDSSIVHDSSVNNHVISFIARFENIQKRHDVMLESMKKIVSVYPDAVLRFYGDGADELLIKEITRKMGLGDNVSFMGYTAQPKKAMDESEVFCMTSDYEGIPNALIEAMSIGMPVVSTDCTPGGARLLIQDGINGLLVDRQSPEQISNAICRLFSDDELRINIGREALKIQDTYSEEKILKKWEDYIIHVINRSNK